MTDLYSGPLMVDALVASREATIDPGRFVPFDSGLPKEMPTPDLLRWTDWVRLYLSINELTHPLRYVDPQAAERQPLLAGLSPPEPGAPDKATELLRTIADRRSWAVYVLDAPPAKARKGVQPEPAYADTSQQVTLRSQPLVQLTRPPRSTFDVQLQQVLAWAELRAERTAEILAQIDNQYPFWGMVVPVHNGRMPRTLELLEVATQFAVFVEARFKHELNCWRPVDLSPQVQPMITTPGHGSLPCGHCTQAYMVARILRELLNEPTDGERHIQLQRIAARISINRVIAGMHFPADNIAGRLLGESLAEYMIARCLPGRSWQPRAFDGSPGSDEAPVFSPSTAYNPFAQALDGKAAPAFYKPLGTPCTFNLGGPLLASMWQMAADECAHLRLPGPSPQPRARS